jgi:tRNA 5-methylaminomethyl-2-thiouridine biosynthesis bifunctional protein
VTPQDCWQGRERYTVFDARYGDGSAVASLIAAWRADPSRPGRLHIVALAEGLLPGFHRLPQQDEAVTLDLLCAPLETALAQLGARIDFARLNGIAGQGPGFARGLARLSASDARLGFDRLDEDQRAALAAQGFVFDDGGEDGGARASPAASRACRWRPCPRARPSSSAPAWRDARPRTSCARAAGR